MADVKVCDRCKKQLKPCSGMRSIITGVKFSYFKFLDDTEYGYKHRDLCHECMMDYEAFMDGCEIIRKGGTDMLIDILAGIGILICCFGIIMAVASMVYPYYSEEDDDETDYAVD